MNKFMSVSMLLLGGAMYCTPVSAQKAADTLRIAINNPFAVLSPYDLPVDEAGMFSREVYDS